MGVAHEGTVGLDDANGVVDRGSSLVLAVRATAAGGRLPTLRGRHPIRGTRAHRIATEAATRSARARASARAASAKPITRR